MAEHEFVEFKAGRTTIAGGHPKVERGFDSTVSTWAPTPGLCPLDGPTGQLSVGDPEPIPAPSTVGFRKARPAEALC